MKSKKPRADGQILDGILYEAEESIATVVHVHGSLGNFYHQRFVSVFAERLTREGVNLLSCNMRTHDGIAEGYDTEEVMEYVGGSIAPFETCVEDILGAVRWCREVGRPVYLQGHSLGCDRVLHYLESAEVELPAILLSPCDSLQLQREWLGEEKFKEQQAALQREDEGLAGSQGMRWTWAPRDAYGLKGEDGWTYEIPITAKVLKSILLGPVGRILAIGKGSEEMSRADALAYLGRRDPIRGASLEAMKAHLEIPRQLHNLPVRTSVRPAEHEVLEP